MEPSWFNNAGYLGLTNHMEAVILVPLVRFMTEGVVTESNGFNELEKIPFANLCKVCVLKDNRHKLWP